MQNWYKNVFVDATVPFQLPYMQIWTVLSNRSHTGFEQGAQVSYVSVLCELHKGTYCLWKPIDLKLDLCDANIQKHQFSNLPAY